MPPVLAGLADIFVLTGALPALFVGILVGLFVAAVLVWATSRWARLAPVAVVVSVLAGAVGLGWTYVTGESGARAVWGQTIANTKPTTGQ